LTQYKNNIETGKQGNKMPLKKKHNSAIRNRIIVATVIIAVVALMIISFPPAQNVTEIVLYP